ncbi:MAG: cell division protein FtsH, partial [Muribaculaceae bacterium]|nr:cell division protein FtsH [Muribaculaceae bacterium]
REVIYTEDVERIFGKRKWTSRLDILDGENNQIENDNTTVALPAGSQPTNDDNSEPNSEENVNNDEVPPAFNPPTEEE